MMILPKNLAIASCNLQPEIFGNECSWRWTLWWVSSKKLVWAKRKKVVPSFYRPVLALSSWIGLRRVRFGLGWGEQLVLWDEEVGSTHASLGLVHPPTYCTEWSQVGAAARSGLPPTNSTHSWGQQTDAIGFGTQSIHHTVCSIDCPIQFANTACLLWSLPRPFLGKPQ